MIVLGIDTSGYVNAVGITDSDRVLADACFPAKTDSLEQIVDNIDVTLKKAGLGLKDVQGIGVGLGPGSFSGLRAAVASASGMAAAGSTPVYGISSGEVLAVQAAAELGRTGISARFDANSNGDPTAPGG